MSDKLNIITCNVQGIAEHFKRRRVFQFLHEKSCDIAFLQETHAVKSKHKIWQSEWGGGGGGNTV